LSQRNVFCANGFSKSLAERHKAQLTTNRIIGQKTALAGKIVLQNFERVAP